MNVQPSATFEATAQFTTGLTGTLGVRITDNAGATTTARVTAAVHEYPAGSGIYYASLTAPATAGQYSLVWDDTTNWASEDLVVTNTDPAAVGSGNLYVTAAELKATLEMTGESYANADIDLAVSTASRAIDAYKNARFYPTTESRVYTASQCACSVSIDDINTVTAVAVDVNGDGTYETTWTSGTDYYLEPVNADLDGRPYDRLTIRSQSGRTFPGWQHGIQITGSFGWAEAPPQVAQAATILAGRYLRRARETPYGILTVIGDAATAARLGKIDPDVAFLLDNLDSDVPQLIA